MTIEMQPVSSSNISAIGYDPVTETLQVNFTSGGRYQYHQVPPEVFDGFESSSSAGTFFHDEIKNVYSYSRM